MASKGQSRLFEVVGADRKSGEDVQRRYRATNPSEAQQQAYADGIVISKVRAMRSTTWFSASLMGVYRLLVVGLLCYLLISIQSVRDDDSADALHRLLTTTNSMESDLRSIDRDVSSIEIDVSSIDTNVSSIESNVRNMEYNVVSLESDVSGIQSDLSSIAYEVSSIQSDVGSIESDLSRIESRLDE